MIGGAGQIPEFFPVSTAKANAPVNNKPPRPQVEPQPNVNPNENNPTDQLILSPQARQVTQFVNQATTTPEVRPDVVARIKATLGQTNDTPGQNAKIAEKLLTEL